jgi:FkbM family methyltransferase
MNNPFLYLTNVAKKTALSLHKGHANAFSYYKLRESKLVTNSPLTALERDFYLKLRPVLQEKSIVFYDIGAAKGILSSCLAKLPNVISIHSFEPIPDVYEQLLQKVKFSSKVHCYNVALGNIESSLPMYISCKTDSSSLLPMAQLHDEQFPDREINHQIKVPVMRLDDLVTQHKLPLPSLVKIDVQGYEKNVIEGGLKTICAAKYCVVEMSFKHLYEGSPLFDDIYRLMYDLGFKLVGLSSPLTGKSGIYLQVDGLFENHN